MLAYLAISQYLKGTAAIFKGILEAWVAFFRNFLESFKEFYWFDFPIFFGFWSLVLEPFRSIDGLDEV
jgi:hypothetical protein